MADIHISSEEVQGKAAQMRACNTSLTETLTSIKNSINALESQWTSDASDTIRAKITAKQTVFDSYKTTIEDYAKFLISTAEQYKKTESAINSNASQFS